MFQLIVAVISIALVAVLAVATIFYGSDAFTSSGEKAKFAAFFNQGSQIEGALKMYGAALGSTPRAESSEAMLQILLDRQYLRTRPEGAWEIEGTSIYLPLDEDTNPGQCRRLNEFSGKNLAAADAHGWDGCPPCGAVAGSPEEALIKSFSDWPGCRKVTITP